MAGQPFSITSPDWERRARGMARTNIHLVARDAAVVVGEKLVVPLREAARRGGASEQLVAAIDVHDAHSSALVMREHGDRADVIVGVDGLSPQAEAAEELEWGSMESRPVGWVRSTYEARKRDVVTMWSNELTRQLDRQVLR